MIDWHDFVVVETIDFADDEDEDLPPPMTLEEVIRRSKVTDIEEDIIEPGKEVEMEMDEEEMQLVEQGMRKARLEENNERRNDNMITDDLEPPMRIGKNWKRPEEGKLLREIQRSLSFPRLLESLSLSMRCLNT